MLGEGTPPLPSGRGLREGGTLRLTLPDVPRARHAAQCAIVRRLIVHPDTVAKNALKEHG